MKTRIGYRILLAALSAAAVALYGWHELESRPVNIIKSRGGIVSYCRSPRWLPPILDGIGICRSVNGICLCDCTIDTDTIEAICDLNSATELDLSGSTIDDSGIDAIANRLVNLRALNVACTRIGDKAIMCLGGLRRLRVLDVSDTLITDGCCNDIGRLSVFWVVMDGTSIGDRAVGIFGNMEFLVSVHISRTNISQQGFEKLRKALPRTIVFSEGVEPQYLEFTSLRRARCRPEGISWDAAY